MVDYPAQPLAGWVDSPHSGNELAPKAPTRSAKNHLIWGDFAETPPKKLRKIP